MASMNSWIYEDDVGKMCAFLISNDSERISGQIIAVDGNAEKISEASIRATAENTKK